MTVIMRISFNKHYSHCSCKRGTTASL